MSDPDLQQPTMQGRPDQGLGRWRLILMIGVPVVVLAIFAWFYLTGGRWQEADNAYLQAARVAVSPSIAGRVVEVRVHENQHVDLGQVMVVLGTAPYEADLRQAEAALAAAHARVTSLRATYRARLAGQRRAVQALAFARREAERAGQLARNGVVSRQEQAANDHSADDAVSALAEAQQATALALADLGGLADIAIEDHPLVREAAARLERARLTLGYTNLVAMQAGIVTRVDQVQVGSYVSPGQTLFWLLAGEPWIEANFKEDQLEHMRVGQSASVRLDAYPGSILQARVASFSPGSGAVFAVLPPQNATGNWVKVVQRLPVRFQLVDPPKSLPLAAGLSAQVRVDTQSTANSAAGR